MATLNFELVSPEKLLVSRSVGMVIVPGEEGDFGVLAGHMALISTLRTGVLNIYDNGVVTERIFITGGLAEVTATRCTVLAEEATSLTELDNAALQLQIKNLRDELAILADEAAQARVTRQLALAEAKLAALADHTYH